VVIGAGASGYFCAVNAARLCPGLKVTILEKTAKTLSKVKVSGGGRCNVTHRELPIAAFTGNYPRGARLLKRTLHQFQAADTWSWFTARNVPLKIEPDGRVFPSSNDSQSIINALEEEARKYAVDIQLHQAVVALKAPSRDTEQKSETDNKWEIQLSGQAAPLLADYICIAVGGLIKRDAYAYIADLGHQIVAPVPSLFTFNLGKHAITELMGVSVESATVRIVGSKLKQSGPLLITHWGFSGPAVLKLSAWGAAWLAENAYQFSILINWLGEAWPENKLRAQWPQIRQEYAARAMGDKNPFGMPKRLWSYLLRMAGIDQSVYWSKLPAGAQNKLIQSLVADNYAINGKTTFKEEFVTCGGVDLAGIDPLTMQSRLHPGLYFTGEVLNVDGITGGFNFQHAWASGFVAASHIAEVFPNTTENQ